ncbi:arabinan endo-1,5-alpha-L-arabinosidase [Capsulimonas corticalis]|nr:arabinan endo-1,5-alpha-L-arabinosidase [Capsulimonas corticalis]
MSSRSVDARSVKNRSLAIFAICALLAPGVLRAAETDCLVRDPSTMVKQDGTYWIYGTGRGVQQFSSTDRLHWTDRGPVFAVRPAWVSEAVPENRHNNAWAPDIHYFHGQYHLYYSYSSFGSQRSGIGVATNSTLDPRAWVDRGVVVQSPTSQGFNTIDPCIFVDFHGQPWLSFGSYFSGIYVVKIDPESGKTAAGAVPVKIATHPSPPYGDIEASAIIPHDGWYYLFVNWGSCCQGEKSTYNIRMGRSKNVTGPFLDKDGKDLKDGGGTIFLDNKKSDGSEVGPGHVGVLFDKDGDWLTTHYEWAKDKSGATTANVDKLTWDRDGWPRVATP